MYSFIISVKLHSRCESNKTYVTFYCMLEYRSCVQYDIYYVVNLGTALNG